MGSWTPTFPQPARLPVLVAGHVRFELDTKLEPEYGQEPELQ